MIAFLEDDEAAKQINKVVKKTGKQPDRVLIKYVYLQVTKQVINASMACGPLRMVITKARAMQLVMLGRFMNTTMETISVKAYTRETEEQLIVSGDSTRGVIESNS